CGSVRREDGSDRLYPKFGHKKTPAGVAGVFGERKREAKRGRSGGDDLDALHLDAVDGRALFAAAAVLGRDGGDLFQHAVTGGELTEGGVLAVEETGLAVADEELAAGAVGMGGAGHGD